MKPSQLVFQLSYGLIQFNVYLERKEQQMDLSALDGYTIHRKTVNSDETILKDKDTSNLILMKEVHIKTSEQFKKMVQTLQGQKGLENSHLLKLIDYKTSYHLDFNHRTSHQITTYHEYSSHSLHQELGIRVGEKNHFEQNQIWSILTSCIFALSYLQKMNIGHGCVSLDDIYLNQSDGTIKIADPSIATSSPFDFTEGYYYSPQVLAYFRENQVNQEQIDIFKSDVFALAMCVLELCSNQSCSECYEYEEGVLLTEFLRQKFNSLIGTYSKDLLNLVYQMLSFDVDLRPSFIQLENYLNQTSQFEQSQSQQQPSQDILYEMTRDNKDLESTNQYAPTELIDSQNNDSEENAKNQKQWSHQIPQIAYPDISFSEIQQNQGYQQQQEAQTPKQFHASTQRDKNQSLKDSEKSRDSPSFYPSGSSNKDFKNRQLFKKNKIVSAVYSQNTNPNLEKNSLKNETVSQNNRNLPLFDKLTSSSQIYTDPDLLDMMRKDVQRILSRRNQSKDINLPSFDFRI